MSTIQFPVKKNLFDKINIIFIKLLPGIMVLLMIFSILTPCYFIFHYLSMFWAFISFAACFIILLIIFLALFFYVEVEFIPSYIDGCVKPGKPWPPDVELVNLNIIQNGLKELEFYNKSDLKKRNESVRDYIIVNLLSPSFSVDNAARASCLAEIGYKPSNLKEKIYYNKLLLDDRVALTSECDITSEIIRNNEFYNFLINRLQSRKPEIRRTIVEVFEKNIDGRSFKPVISIFKTENDIDVKKSIVKFSAVMDKPEYYEFMVSNLEDKSDVIRKMLINALNELGSSDAIPEIIKRLEDENKDVRNAAAEFLVKHDDYRSFKSLASNFKNIQDVNIRKKIINIFSDNDNLNFCEFMACNLDDESFEIRKMLISKINESGDQNAVPEVLKLIENENEYLEIKKTALEYLDKFNSPQILESVSRVVLDGKKIDPDIMKMSVILLYKYNSPSVIGPVIFKAFQNNDKNIQFYMLLSGKYGVAESVDLLIKKLQDVNKEIRIAAARALVQFGASNPSCIKEKWGLIKPVITCPHNDYTSRSHNDEKIKSHRDERDDDPNCMKHYDYDNSHHVDNSTNPHTDSGIGIAFRDF